MADLSKSAGPSTRRIDVAGRVVVPGFNDAHIHLNPQPRYERVAVKGQEPWWDEVRTAVAEAAHKFATGPMLMADIASRVLGDTRVNRAALDAISASRATAPTSPTILPPFAFAPST